MLKIAKNLELPEEAVTQTFGILAKRGVGKTYTASVLAEEMLKAGLQVVIVDPIGVWWGLRSAANGKDAGLEIVIAGGDHADVPIEPSSGELLADLVVNEKMSVVIDLSLFRKGEQVKFMTDFAETLYHRNRTALHLIVDEADAFAPQRVFGNEARMLGAMEDLVRRGRARGIGVTMITQRPSVLNKNVLTQIEVLIALRMTAPIDQKAIDEWIRTHAEEDQREKFMTTLPSLPIGTAWFWSPGWLDIFQKIEVRKRETLDSSSTPKVGQKVTKARMAEVDLDKVREKLAGAIERTESNDPKLLQRRIIELERELKKRPEPTLRTEVVSAVAREQVADMVTAAYTVIHELEKFAAITVADTMEDLDTAWEGGANDPTGNTKKVPSTNKVTPVMPTTKLPQSHISDDKSLPKIGSGEFKILVAAGQHPNGVTKTHITILTSYKRSSRNTYISRLVARGLVEVTGDLVTITDAGIAELGNDFDPLPTGDALQQRLLSELPVGEKSILQTLIEAWPNGISRDEISEKTGYMRSSRNTYLSRMVAREIVEVAGQEVRANDKLFEGAK